jgi:hypothetical protein
VSMEVEKVSAKHHREIQPESGRNSTTSWTNFLQLPRHFM